MRRVSPATTARTRLRRAPTTPTATSPPRPRRTSRSRTRPGRSTRRRSRPRTSPSSRATSRAEDRRTERRSGLADEHLDPQLADRLNQASLPLVLGRLAARRHRARRTSRSAPTSGPAAAKRLAYGRSASASDRGVPRALQAAHRPLRHGRIELLRGQGEQALRDLGDRRRARSPDELGLERYQQYDGEDLGGGFDHALNLANGNNVVQWVPFSQPGRGLNTVVTMTYNSLEHGSVSPLGNNWSLAISSLTPFGLPLDVHPNASDTAAGKNAEVGRIHATGRLYHVFTGNTAGTYYTAPPGVHLYLKADAEAAGSSGSPTARSSSSIAPASRRASPTQTGTRSP